MISPADDVKYLIDLDTLLDTRLATVSLLDPLHASTLLHTTYRIREHDQFQSKLYSVQEYQNAYKNRTVQTVMQAGPTGLAGLIMELIQEDVSLREAVAGPYIFDIDLNVYPYKLQPDECTELVDVLYQFFPLARNIRTVFLDTKVITPSFLKSSNFSYFFTYDFQAWLKHHVHAFEHTAIPRLTIVAPKLRETSEKVEVDSTDEDAQLLLGSLGVFGALELYLQEYVSLRLEDVRYFSLLE